MDDVTDFDRDWDDSRLEAFVSWVEERPSRAEAARTLFEFSGVAMDPRNIRRLVADHRALTVLFSEYPSPHSRPDEGTSTRHPNDAERRHRAGCAAGYRTSRTHMTIPIRTGSPATVQPDRDEDGATDLFQNSIWGGA